MEIKRNDDKKKGHFYTELDGQTAGEMHYVWAGSGKIIIDHTEVGEQFKGKNIGKQLVQAAVDYARAEGIKILPLCPFAKHVFDTTPQFADVRV